MNCSSLKKAASTGNAPSETNFRIFYRADPMAYQEALSEAVPAMYAGFQT